MHVKSSGGIFLFVGKWVEWGVGLFLSFQGRTMAFGNALAMVEFALQLQLQLPATATARPDPSCIWDCSISEGNPGSRDCTCLLSYTGQVHSNVATTGMPAGSFFLTTSFSVLGISPVIFSRSSEFSLGRLYFARKVSISSRKSVFLA